MNRGIDVGFGLSYADAEVEAIDFAREFASILPPDRRDPRSVLESLDELQVNSCGRSVPLNWRVSSLAQLKAVASFEDGTVWVVVGEDTYRGICAEDPHHVFTLYHELGHVWLHTPAIIELDRMPHLIGLRRGGNHPSFEDSEYQANAFAAAVLMPASDLFDLERRLRRPLQPMDLVKRFGVSARSAAIRLGVFAKKRAELASVVRNKRGCAMS